MRPKKASSVFELWPWFVAGLLCAGCTAFGYGLAAEKYYQDCSTVFGDTKANCADLVRQIWGLPY